jgi:hypothetical protein
MNFQDLLAGKRKDYFYIMHLSYNGDRREKLWNYAKDRGLIGLDVQGIVTDDGLKFEKG